MPHGIYNTTRKASGCDWVEASVDFHTLRARFRRPSIFSCCQWLRRRQKQFEAAWSRRSEFIGRTRCRPDICVIYPIPTLVASRSRHAPKIILSCTHRTIYPSPSFPIPINRRSHFPPYAQEVFPQNAAHSVGVPSSYAHRLRAVRFPSRNAHVREQ